MANISVRSTSSVISKYTWLYDKNAEIPWNSQLFSWPHICIHILFFFFNFTLELLIFFQCVKLEYIVSFELLRILSLLIISQFRREQEIVLFFAYSTNQVEQLGTNRNTTAQIHAVLFNLFRVWFFNKMKELSRK